MSTFATYDSDNSECVIYTWRTGIASAVGHDLAIEVQDFSIEVDPDAPSIEASFRPDSLRVRHAVEGQEPAPGKLSDRDKRKIQKNIRKDVLETRRFPSIRFESTEISLTQVGGTVRGELELHGVTCPITVEVSSDDGRSVGRAKLHQPDFDIEPYSTFLGALKLEPDVEVEVSVPLALDELAGGAETTA